MNYTELMTSRLEAHEHSVQAQAFLVINWDFYRVIPANLPIKRLERKKSEEHLSYLQTAWRDFQTSIRFITSRYTTFRDNRELSGHLEVIALTGLNLKNGIKDLNGIVLPDCITAIRPGNLVHFNNENQNSHYTIWIPSDEIYKDTIHMRKRVFRVLEVEMDIQPPYLGSKKHTVYYNRTIRIK